MKEQLSQWFKCYKSYWWNLSLFIFCMMSATIILNFAILTFSSIGLFILSILAILVLLVYGFSHFKTFNDKNRYITFLQVKKLLEKEKYDIR
jgi:uncharacterized membrane protein